MPTDSSAESSKNQTLKMIFVSGSKATPAADSFAAAMAKDKRIEFMLVTGPDDITAIKHELTHGIILSCLSSTDEVKNFLNFMVTLQPQIDSGLIRIQVITTLNHPKLIQLLRSRGCSEVVDYKLSAKGLYYKVQNLIEVVKRAWADKDKPSISKAELEKLSKKDSKINLEPSINEKLLVGEQSSNASRSKKTEKQTDQNLSLDGKKIKKEPELKTKKIKVSALDLKSDCWVLVNDRDVREAMGSWIIYLLGPGPSYGFWEESDYEQHKGKSWLWKSRNPENDTFIQEEGAWVFFGRSPEFNWDKNLWCFVSQTPILGFFRNTNEKTDFYRFNLLNKTCFNIADNSKLAPDLTSKIKATLENSIRYKTELSTSKPLKRDEDIFHRSDTLGNADEDEALVLFLEDVSARGWKDVTDLFKGIEFRVSAITVQGQFLKKPLVVSLLDFDGNENISLEVPNEIAIEGNQIGLHAVVEERGELVEGKFKVFIEVVSQQVEENSILFCRFAPGESAKTKFIRQIYERRQTEINTFVNDAEGKASSGG